MEHVYSFRLDKATGQMLQLLAARTFRSRAGVVRWLINQAGQNPYLVLPEVGVPADGPSTTNIEPTKGSEPETQR